MTIAPKVLGGIKERNPRRTANFESELKRNKWWKIFGDAPKADNELLLGSGASKVLNAGTGDRITIKDESFKVAGVLDRTGS